MEGLLKALGWKFAEQGKKAKPHAPVFDALGVTLDLTACRKGSIKVYNRKSRVADLKLDASGSWTRVKYERPRHFPCIGG